MVHPTCGLLPTERGVKIIAVISLFFTLCLISLEIFLICTYGPPVPEDIGSEFADTRIQNLVEPIVSPIDLDGKDADTKLLEPNNGIHLFNMTLFNTTTTTPSTTTKMDIAEENFNRLFKVNPKSFKVVTAIWFLSWALDIGLSLLLFIGAHQRSKTKCLVWFYIRCALLFFRIMFLIFYILAGITLIRKIPVIFTFFFRIYCLWLVNVFIEELRMEKLQKASNEVKN